MPYFDVYSVRENAAYFAVCVRQRLRTSRVVVVNIVVRQVQRRLASKILECGMFAALHQENQPAHSADTRHGQGQSSISSSHRWIASVRRGTEWRGRFVAGSLHRRRQLSRACCVVADEMKASITMRCARADLSGPLLLIWLCGKRPFRRLRSLTGFLPRLTVSMSSARRFFLRPVYGLSIITLRAFPDSA